MKTSGFSAGRLLFYQVKESPGHRKLEIHVAARHRMRKAQGQRMKRKPIDRAARRPIFSIPYDRMSELFRGMHTDLILAAGVERKFHKRAAGASLQHPPAGNRRLAILLPMR